MKLDLENELLVLQMTADALDALHSTHPTLVGAARDIRAARQTIAVRTREYVRDRDAEIRELREKWRGSVGEPVPIFPPIAIPPTYGPVTAHARPAPPFVQVLDAVIRTDDIVGWVISETTLLVFCRHGESRFERRAPLEDLRAAEGALMGAFGLSMPSRLPSESPVKDEIEF